MRSLLFLIISCFCFSGYSQVSKGDLGSYSWRIIPGVSNKNAVLIPGPMAMNMGTGTGFSGPFDAGKIELSPTEQIVAINLKYNEFAIIRISEDQKVSWVSPVGGRPMKLGLIGDKVVIVHGGDMQDRKARQDVQATVLEVSSGKKVSNKKLYTTDPEIYVEPKIFFPKGSTDFYLGLRYTDSKNKDKVFLPYGPGGMHIRANYMMSTKFELVTYDVNLNQKEKTNVPFKGQHVFIQAEMNAAREIFVVYVAEENSISIEKILANHKEVKEVKRINLDLRKNTSPSFNFYLSELNDNICYFTFRYRNSDKDRTLAIHKIDFNTGESKSYTEVIDKVYKARVKDKFNPAYDNPGRLNLNEWNYMEITGFAEQGDKIMVLMEALVQREWQGVNDSWAHYSIENGDGIVAMFDQNLKIIDETPFSKSSALSGFDEPSSSLKIHGNKLMIVSPSGSGLGIGSVIFEYDINSRKLVKKFTPERGEVKKSHSLITAGTLWFQNSLMIPVLTDRGFYDTNQRLLKVKL